MTDPLDDDRRGAPAQWPVAVSEAATRRASAPRVRVRHGPDPHRPLLRRKIIAGLTLGSFGYLLVSCFYAAELDRPKINRTRFRFDHGPPP